MDEVNRLDRTAFVEAFGWIFEHSPWVAERAWEERRFRDARALLESMVRQVEKASAEEQMALLRAHPDLGTKAKLSEASGAEQAGAGLDQLTVEEFELFTALNNGYKEKFGFPFLYAVKAISTTFWLRWRPGLTAIPKTSTGKHCGRFTGLQAFASKRVFARRLDWNGSRADGREVITARAT